MAQVRVTQMKELIYKNGLAGVNKANVTINFDNTDKSLSPEEYKRFPNLSIRREIRCDGTSLYTLNGSKTTADKMKNLFMHVGLNVENASFIIMQGRIGQVVGMKPRDILRQIEEAAHITMYEKRKNEALRTIEKKNRKFQEIEKILEEELEPKIKKLGEEREEYYAWKVQNQELEKLEESIAKYQHRDCKNRIEQEDAHKQDYQEKLIGLKKAKRDSAEKVEKLVTELEEQRAALTQFAEDNEAIQKIKKELKNQAENLKNKETEMKDREKEISRLTSAIEQAKSTIVEANTKRTETKAKVERFEYKEQQSKATIENYKDKLHAQGDTNPIEIIEQQIWNRKAKQNEVDEELKKLTVKMNSDTDTINQKSKQLERAQEEQVKTEAQIEILKKRVAEIATNHDTAADSELQKQIQDKKSEREHTSRQFEEIREELRRLNANMYSLDCTNVEPGVKSRIIGRVIRNFKVKDNQKHARAIEAMLGGKIQSIITVDDNTAAHLIQKKIFGNMSFLPNNKMLGKVIHPDQQTQIQKVVGPSAQLALNLITFDPNIEATIKYLFGNFYICETKDAARKVAFDFHVYSVDLNGDMYDPLGTLSGGDNPNKVLHTQRLVQIVDLEKERENLTKAQ